MQAADLAPLYDASGPYVSVYIDTDPAVGNADQQLESRWRSVREVLAADGADDATLDALEKAVRRDTGSQAPAQVLFASGGAVRYSRHLSEALTRELAVVEPLPYVTPLLSWAQLRVPHVVVLADRTGADISAFTDRADAIFTDEVKGSNDEIRRVSPGGWSQMRYQHRAEDSWERNMAEAADQASRIADAIGAELVLVNGDIRAVQLFRDHAPKHLARRVEVVESGGGRAKDGSEELVSAEVAEHVLAAAVAKTTAFLQKFEEERGQNDRASDGVEATVEALTRAQVETLLLHDNADDERKLWFGPDPTLVATERQTLIDLGVEEPQQGRLSDVLVRAAVGTGADVRIVLGTGAAAPTDGVGAVLRFALGDPATG